MDNLLPLIVAVLGAGGFGAFFREIAAGVAKVAGGMSARESSRKVDIVEQRDKALSERDRAWKQVDAEAEKRRLAQEDAARLRRLCIVNGIDPGTELVFSKTITRTQLEEQNNKEKT